MIRRVAAGQSAFTTNPPSAEEKEIAAECLEQGYLFPGSTGILNAQNKVCRTLDYTPQFNIKTGMVPYKGLCFLAPNKAERRSAWALGISFAALIVSILANLQTIAGNLQAFLH